MSDHSDLVAEIIQVEKMNTPDRLKHAKKRRAQQLKRFSNYEKQLDKEQTKKRKQAGTQKKQHRKRTRVRFIHNITLLEAAARNDMEEVKKMLVAGVGPDVTNEDGLTALHQCCIDDNEPMLRLLLEFGANVNARDSEMWTPLHAAATCGHVHLCKFLIDKGATLLAVNADGNMPYDICEDEVTLDYIETEMAKRGITQEQIDDKRLETEKHMLRDLKKIAADGGDLEFKDTNRATPLHIASANGYLEVVEFLLEHNVSMRVKDSDSWMPIHAAACWLQPEVLEILVKHGADLDSKTRYGETPFDLCEDPDIKQKILDMKDAIETHRAGRSRDTSRGSRHKINTRGLQNTGSVYSSNGSLNEKPNSHSTHHSASIRRTSMRGEKSPLAKKEAKEEALHFGMYHITSGEEEDVEDNKENVPATNIDDVTINIIEEDAELTIREKDRHESQGRQENPHKQDSTQGRQENPHKQDSTQGRQENPHKQDSTQGRQENPHKQDSRVGQPASGYKDSQRGSKEVPPRGQGQQVLPRPAAPPKPDKPDNFDKQQGTRDSGKAAAIKPKPATGAPAPKPVPPVQAPPKAKETSLKPEAERHQGAREGGPPTTRNAQQGGQPTGRTPSFRKNRDSQRGQPREQADQVRYPSGVPTGTTLADLKKHRLENYKQGQKENSLDATVQDLFLTSLLENNKYSSSPRSNSQSPPSKQENNSSQNGRSISTKNNNNNNSSQRPPPTFLNDSGPLRRFSAPTAHPVIGEDDKFKSNCCVVM